MSKVDTARAFYRFIRSDISAELPMQQFGILVEVYRTEGITMPEIGEIMGMPQGSVSRNIRALSTWADKKGVWGHGLLETRQDLYERRRFAVHLTEKGKSLMEKVMGHFADVSPGAGKPKGGDGADTPNPGPAASGPKASRVAA